MNPVKNNCFLIRYNMENGGVASIVNASDKDKMNWVHENCTWGRIKDARVVSVTQEESGLCAVYETLYFRVTVHRSAHDTLYRETYTFENRLPSEVFVPRGGEGNDHTLLCADTACRSDRQACKVYS